MSTSRILNLARAKDITIRGKNVVKLECNGKIIWEKYVPKTITLESDKTTLVQGETIQFTATVYDKFNRGCPNKTVEFINNDTGEVIGSGVTDDEGKCSVGYSVKDTEDLNIQAVSSSYISNNITITNLLWNPKLDGTTGAKIGHSYSEANGEAIGKGFVLNGGFPNVDKWELSFEFKHDNIRYTGICLLCDTNSSCNGITASAREFTTWEGTFPNTTPYASWWDGAIDWFDITIRKIDATHIHIRSEKLNKDSDIVEWSYLNQISQLSCGARHNSASSSYGPCRIRNVVAKYI